VFVVDTSGSIGETKIGLKFEFIERLVRSLNVEGDASDLTISRIGMLMFASKVKPRFYLNSYRTRSRIVAEIRKSRYGYPQGSTNTDAGIRLVYQDGLWLGLAVRFNRTR